MCLFNVSVPHVTHFLHHVLNCYMHLHTHILTLDFIPRTSPKIRNDRCMSWLLSSFCVLLRSCLYKRTLVLSCTKIVIPYLTALFMGVDNCTLQRCLIGAQPVFLGVVLFCWCDAVTLSVCLPKRVNPGMQEQTRRALASSACTQLSRSLIEWVEMKYTLVLIWNYGGLWIENVFVAHLFWWFLKTLKGKPITCSAHCCHLVFTQGNYTLPKVMC